MLVDKGAGVKAVAKDGSTPLHLAAQNGYKEIGQMLVDMGTKRSARCW
jgi:ankyrin repeat protein